MRVSLKKVHVMIGEYSGRECNTVMTSVVMVVVVVALVYCDVVVPRLHQ